MGDIGRIPMSLTGDWRNWLARTDGVREAAGSNPVSPTHVCRNKCSLDFVPLLWDSTRLTT